MKVYINGLIIIFCGKRLWYKWDNARRGVAHSFPIMDILFGIIPSILDPDPYTPRVLLDALDPNIAQMPNTDVLPKYVEK